MQLQGQLKARMAPGILEPTAKSGNTNKEMHGRIDPHTREKTKDGGLVGDQENGEKKRTSVPSLLPGRARPSTLDARSYTRGLEVSCGLR